MLYTLAFSIKDVLNGNFWDYIGDLVSNIWGTIVNFLSGLISALGMLWGISTFSFSLVGFVPVVISTSVTLVLICAIVKAVLFQDQQ